MLQNLIAVETSTLDEFILKSPRVRTCPFILAFKNANQLLADKQPLPDMEKIVPSIERENPAS